MCTHQNLHNAQPGSDIHSQEHEKWSRRSFLQALGFVGGGSMLLGANQISAAVNSPLSQAINDTETENILVLIRLKGGNDGLNTIVPVYDYDKYANFRPNLRHLENSLIKLDDDFGMPNYMSDLESMWGEGSMKVVHGVGYENQTLSHFKSSDIWASSVTDNSENSGFMGRYFNGLYPDYLVNPPEKPAAIQIGSFGNLIFDDEGINNYAITISSIRSLQSIGESGELHSLNDIEGTCEYSDRLKFLRGVTNNTFTYAGVISDAYAKGQNAVPYPDKEISKLGQQLKEIARMIKGDLGTKVYMVSLNGFDTHANQLEEHPKLWKDISIAIKTFYEDLAETEHDTKVLSMTISEFGRRAEENGSKGTDHGEAAPIMLFGPAIQDNGFVGNHPDLNDLDRRGNLKYTVDFREVYAAAMKEWLCIDPETVDKALKLETSFADRSFGFSCKGILNTRFPSSSFNFEHFTTNQVEAGIPQTLLHYENKMTGHINISVFDMSGSLLKVLREGFIEPGAYYINLSKELKEANTGIYIYRAVFKGDAYSAKFIM